MGNEKRPEPSIDLVDQVDSVRRSLDGLSTIALSLAVSEMADKPSLSVVSEALSSCADVLGNVSSGVQDVVTASRKATMDNAGARTAAPLAHGFDYAMMEV